jgi:hypothetical protein
MELVVTGIESFVAIVGLLGQFLAERSGQRAVTHDEFMAWLAEKNHHELMRLLEINAKATISIKALLNQGRDQLLERLDKIDRTLAAVAGNHDGFRELALELSPASLLSDQAVDILRQFCATGASRSLEIWTNDGLEYMFLDGRGNGVTIGEPQFVESDFAALVQYGFLLQDQNGRGQKVFVLTRPGAAVVRAAGS